MKLARRLVVVSVLLLASAATAEDLGSFEGHDDIGTVLHPGAASYGGFTHTVTGSGENMWGTKDAFHFVWKKCSGDVMMSAGVAITSAGDPHRKAALMIRQTLDADSAYADVALHGEGLTSLQFRETAGGATHEIQSNMSGPDQLRIVKRGGYVLMYLAGKDEALHYSGAAVPIVFKEPFYIGLAVCAHNKDAVTTAKFSDVQFGDGLQQNPPTTQPSPRPISTLETQSVSSTDRRVCLVIDKRIEAPNWSHDGASLIYNSGGRLYRVPAVGGAPEVIDTGFAIRCNNDHGLSPDGSTLAISDQSQGDRKSRIYTVPATGGAPKLITPDAPSYFHGWSPDGKTLTFCGERNKEFDVYTIAAAGGQETRLTSAKGLDDGPEFSPDGQFIYFNSDRTGTMQIYRMKADGSAQEQLTHDEFNNWFPHASPDGRRLVFVSYDKDVLGHPEGKNVALKMLTIDSGKIDTLGKLFGGQGTANVANWSPDGKKIAFVSYQPS